MKSVAARFSDNSTPAKIAPALAGKTLQPELVRLAGAFVDLQQARHEADYDLSRPFLRQEVIDLVTQAEHAQADSEAVRKSLQADVFLVGLFALRHLRA
jgi:hypothetical protein